jgi:hypothetical protein
MAHAIALLALLHGFTHRRGDVMQALPTDLDVQRFSHGCQIMKVYGRQYKRPDEDQRRITMRW